MIAGGGEGGGTGGRKGGHGDSACSVWLWESSGSGGGEVGVEYWIEGRAVRREGVAKGGTKEGGKAGEWVRGGCV